MEQRNAAPEEQLPQLDGIAQNAKAEDFCMKNKVYEIIRYGNVCLKDFPRYERYTLAADIRQCMYAILRHVITLENKHYIRPVSMGAEFVGFRVWATHVKLRRKTARKMVKRLEYVFAAYRAGEIDREGMERTVASYKGILKHFNSHGMAKKLNEIYKKEVSGNGRGTDKGGT